MHYSLRTLSLLIIGSISLVAAFVFGSQGSKNLPLVSKTEAESKPIPTKQASPNERPLPLLDLPALTRNADLIVLGQITSIRESGRVTITLEGKATESQSMVAELTARGVLKGKVDSPRIFFTFAVPMVESGYKTIAPSQFGLFFLRADGDERFTVLSPYYPFLVAASDSPKLKGNDLDRVVGTIAHLLAQPSAELRREAIYILDTASTDEATDALRRAASDGDTVVKLQALAALLRRGDISVLNIAEDFLLHPKPNVDEYLRRNVSVSLEGIKDPRAIVTLVRLLAAPDIQTRRSSAGALRHMHTTAAIGPLLTALESSDRGVRYQGVIGLAELTGQDEWAPSVELFQKDEQHFIAHWKEWGRTQK